MPASPAADNCGQPGRSAGRLRQSLRPVYDAEPLPLDDPLRGAPDTVLVPHLGYVTERGYRTMYEQVVEDITAWRAGTPVRVLTG